MAVPDDNAMPKQGKVVSNSSALSDEKQKKNAEERPSPKSAAVFLVNRAKLADLLSAGHARSCNPSISLVSKEAATYIRHDAG